VVVVVVAMLKNSRLANEGAVSNAFTPPAERQRNAIFIWLYQVTKSFFFAAFHPLLRNRRRHFGHDNK
jgi:hypothetical protein